MTFAAIGACVVTHVFHNPKYGHIDEVCHLDSLANNHFHKLLGAGNHHYSVKRQRLKHGQRYVARSRWHIHKHVVYVFPDYIRPELRHNAADYRSAPHNRVGFVRQNEVYAHYLRAVCRNARIYTLFRHGNFFVQSECLRNRRSRNVGVQHCRVFVPALRHYGKQ